jgi:hypothetical protein
MSGRALVSATLIVSLAALGCVALLVYGPRGTESSSSETYITQPTPAEAPAPTQAQGPTPARARRPASPAGATRSAGDAAFWQLVDETRSSAGTDTARQSELLQERLTQLPPRAIVGFAQTRRRLDRRLYTWKLWGAAAVIEDGCSDDCFRDFRAYVISLGRDAYERALRDPDSLAPLVQNAETGDWENADNVAPDAYSSVTGNDFPLDDPDLSGRPSGTPVEFDGGLTRRYPRLAARFRHG